ncbi:uncharacterized protein EAE98_001564 [Botrytis deweyae]|uniref:2EXR domain-containing protein n=1 Tax=Botrytis deweyae TaxID=2478750 RepID=A0ABQ7IY61_9HELO|nr:uncharacterized protein EAE98_001564 [Botrytis deweyae]KAF7937250.1 hypothetical protein EAE98_001564 [Botrytis deweyae]
MQHSLNYLALLQQGYLCPEELLFHILPNTYLKISNYPSTNKSESPDTIKDLEAEISTDQAMKPTSGDWYDLGNLSNHMILSTVEEYAQYPTGGISRVPARSRYVFVKQKYKPLRIGWRDEVKNDHSDVKFKAKDDGVQVNQVLLNTQPVYCPKTWQISKIKFYHDLPTNAIQIAWPTDYCAIVPILDSFALFPKLPTEIQHMIWDFALSCNPRNVKLKIDRKYHKPNKSDGEHGLELSCHIRQHGPIASKLPISLLYVCQESHSLFLKKYSKMNLSVPVQRCDLNLEFVRYRLEFEEILDDYVVDCKIQIDRKGYIDFHQDTLMIPYFRKITGILWDWDFMTLDLSLIESIAINTALGSSYTGRSGLPSYYGGKKSIWELLEIRCPNLKRLSLITGSRTMEKNGWESDEQPVARILPINAAFIDGITYGFQVSCQDECSRMESQRGLKKMKREHRRMMRILTPSLKADFRRAQAIISSHHQQIIRNRSYWEKVDVNLAYIAWVVSSFYTGEKMEKVIVTPPKDLQLSMPDSYFWAQRPIEIVDYKPILRFGEHGFPIACRPDGSLLNRYEGARES